MPGPRPMSVRCHIKKMKEPVHKKDLLASKGMLPGAEMRSGKPRHSWSVIRQRIQRIMLQSKKCPVCQEGYHSIILNPCQHHVL